MDRPHRLTGCIHGKGYMRQRLDRAFERLLERAPLIFPRGELETDSRASRAVRGHSAGVSSTFVQPDARASNAS
jgi:hypothetical protein